jgi:hypothetical protein
MVDGQVLPGSPTVATDGADGGVVDRVAWSARLWGPVLIDLEGVRRVVVNARAAARVMQGSLERGAASEDRVVLALGEGRFAPRRVIAGAESGERIAILEGLAAGEQVVVAGQFLLDSEANLRSGLGRLDSE